VPCAHGGQHPATTAYVDELDAAQCDCSDPLAAVQEDAAGRRARLARQLEMADELIGLLSARRT